MTVAVHDPDPPAAPDPTADPDDQPADLPAERALLAAVLYVGQTDTPAAHALVDELATTVAPADMWSPDHERLWAAMVDATALGQPLDPASLAASVGSAVGLLPRLVTLATPAGAATHHAGRVATAAAARRVIAAGKHAVQRGYAHGFDPAVDVPDLVSRLEQAAGASHAGRAVAVASVVERAVDLIENPERVDVIPSGLHDLDMLYPGLRPGQLVVVGARPSVGKSVLGLTLSAEAAIRLRLPTVLFSAEMTRLEVTQRLICARASVDLAKVLAGALDDAEWAKVARHLPVIAEAPLFIDDTSDLTIGHIRAEVRRLHRRAGLRAVVVDYLQLITLARSESRQVGVDEVARQLKVLAGDVGVPVVLLSQLNRGPEQRHDKRPMLSDLRESGGIENHADVVILIHRPDFYDPNDRPGECDLIVAKHRNGRTGTAPVAFQGHYARLASMTNWAM